MKQIDTYKITWRPCENVGLIHLGLADGSGGKIEVESAQEMSLLVDMLRNEAPVFWDPVHCFIMTGFEPVGEGSADADAGKAA